MNKLNGRAIQNIIADFDCFGVLIPTVKKCNDFIKNIGSYRQWGKIFCEAVPMAQGSFMMLIVRCLQGNEITGINKKRNQTAVP